MRFKEWNIECGACALKEKRLAWDYEFPINCNCGGYMNPYSDSVGQSAGIATDEIPGGIEIKHGLCNPDGTPKRYYSKTEIKRAANERGYTIAGDSPVPYRVSWSGRQKRIDGIKTND